MLEMAAEGEAITIKWTDGRTESDGWRQKREGSNRRREGKILKAWVGLSSPQPLNIYQAESETTWKWSPSLSLSLWPLLVFWMFTDVPKAEISTTVFRPQSCFCASVSANALLGTGLHPPIWFICAENNTSPALYHHVYVRYRSSSFLCVVPREILSSFEPLGLLKTRTQQPEDVSFLGCVCTHVWT